MKDYIGKYVKCFESGTKGCLSLGSCGNDWGLSCGSYQLILRYGNCIKFLKKYFPNESRSLYFNSDKKDIAVDYFPGYDYCSSPEAVKSAWIRAYNSVGSEKFFEYEHEYMKTVYYDKLKNKLKDILDLDKLNDRAYFECFWSWGIHKGVSGAYNSFIELLSENDMESVHGIDKEYLFDLIYNKRYDMNPFARYKKGVKDGSSEREVLRKLLTPGKIIQVIHNDETMENPTEEMSTTVISCKGTIKIIHKYDDGVNARKYPNLNSDIIEIYRYGEIYNVVGITDDKAFYLLENGNYITASTKYVQFFEYREPEKELYRVRIKQDGLEIKSSDSESSKTVGTLNKNGVYTIIKESNGYGFLKSKVGWIKLSEDSVKKLISQ